MQLGLHSCLHISTQQAHLCSLVKPPADLRPPPSSPASPLDLLFRFRGAAFFFSSPPASLFRFRGAAADPPVASGL